MMIIKLIEEKFWLPVLLSLFLGFLFPQVGKDFNFLIIPLIMINFFLASLKIDFIDVLKHIKKPAFIIYIVTIYLLLVPIGVYWLFSFVNQELAIGMLLLSSMPPGAASPILSDMFKGNVSLSMAIAIISYIISPFTVILLFYFLAQKTLPIDLGSLFQTLLIINFIPLIAAQTIRKINISIVEKTKKYYSLISVCCLCALVFIPISAQAERITSDLFGGFINVLWLNLLFILLWLIGYFSAFWKSKPDKTSIAVTKTFMNNGIAIGLAYTFFTPQIILLMVLSEVPWSTTLGPFKYLLKHLK